MTYEEWNELVFAEARVLLVSFTSMESIQYKFELKGLLAVSSEGRRKLLFDSVRELRALGLTPHLLACRSAQVIGARKKLIYFSYFLASVVATKVKLSQFCHAVDNILNVHDVPNIWHVPLLLQNQNGHLDILKQLDCLSNAIPPNLEEWTTRAETFDNLKNSVRKALVGKYIGLTDSYLSVVKALLHTCIACSIGPSIDWIAASDLEDATANSAPESHAAAWETLRSLMHGEGILFMLLLPYNSEYKPSPGWIIMRRVKTGYENTDRPVVAVVKLRVIKYKIDQKRYTASDRYRNTVSGKDVVKILMGRMRDQGGEMPLHIGWLWKFQRSSSNHGFLDVRHTHERMDEIQKVLFRFSRRFGTTRA
ncbi:CTP synthase-like [Papaver somniferum]|uniref:CTP synthase-like n=1 Tax=Papaver somniferum TaxID=3469 RepID=UPI000E70032A|nr:CTP synthase-like [Papaver somniferum]